MWWLDPGKEVLNVVRIDLHRVEPMSLIHHWSRTVVQPHPRALRGELGHEPSELWDWTRQVVWIFSMNYQIDHNTRPIDLEKPSSEERRVGQVSTTC